MRYLLPSDVQQTTNSSSYDVVTAFATQRPSLTITGDRRINQMRMSKSKNQVGHANC